MKINKFEDLLVWQKARELTNYLYEIKKKFPSDERFNLTDRIRRCLVSIAANIAEGFSRYHPKETILFYRNSRGSLSELKSHLYISNDRGYITNSELSNSFEMIDEVGKMLNGLIRQTDNFRQLTSNTYKTSKLS